MLKDLGRIEQLALKTAQERTGRRASVGCSRRSRRSAVLGWPKQGREMQ